MTDWKAKLAAYLHDPPSKCLDISTHGERSDAAFKQAGFVNEEEIGDYFKHADHTGAAADRLPFPGSRAGGLQCAFDGRRNTFRHPLCGEPLPFHSEFRSVEQGFEGEGVVQPRLSPESLDALQDDDERWRARFFAHWRLWPKFALEKDCRLGLLPADTRIPDHSIWTHMQVVSALAGCLEADGAWRPAFLKFQVGPVQDFIAAARSIRDLWSGSYLLSWLMAAGLKALSHRIGPDAVIFPSLRGQPLFDLRWREELWSRVAIGNQGPVWDSLGWEGRDLLTPTLPNVFLAVVPASRAAELGRAVERVTNNAALPVRYAYGVEQDGANGPWREVSIEIRDDGAGNTNEWVKTFLDGMGRGYKTVYASASGTPYRLLSCNNLGQLTDERDPDGVTRLDGYNARGERYRSGIDMDGSGVLEPNGVTGTDDRLSETFETVVAAEAGTNSLGRDLRRVQTWVYATNNSSVPMLVRTVDVSNDGLKRAEIRQRDSSTPVTNRTETVYATNGIRTVTVTSPDNSSQVSVYSYGRLQSVTRKDSTGGQVSQTAYGYDAHGRQSTVTDARNGTTAFAYNNADQVVSVTAPLLGTGEAAQVTTSFYDQAGRVIGQQLPDGTTTTNLYTTTGLLQRTYGSRLYPVEYTYDAQGRMRTMTTWQNFAGNSGTATTRWNYDAYRGWLKSKDYPDAATGEVLAGSGPFYTNSPAGRLQTRDWKRGVRTTYGYNAAGDLASVAYSDGTPGTTYAYDRRGRRLTSVRDSITTTFSYTDTDQPLTESHSGGSLDGLSMNRTYDSSLRVSSVTAKNGAATLQNASYGYDTAGQLETVADGSASATYAYHPNSTLISTLTLTNSGSAGLVTSRTYDKLNRLTSISSKAYGSSAPSLPVSFGYQYNPANQRTRATLQDGSFWGYQYDALGQVVSGKKYWADGTPVAGQQFEYGFDDIGNRTATMAGGSASGQGLRSASYTVTRLNQHTNRTVPAALDVLGLANPVATVTVNSNTNVYRRGEYFWKEQSIDNSSAAQWTALTVNAAFGPTNQSSSGYVLLTKTPEVFIHDADGNLLSDGRWTNTWDAENRLIGMLSLTNAPAESKRWLQFKYDQQGRRILKTVCWWTNSAWRVVVSNKFLYDGWNLVAELNATNNALIRSYVWGNDLSGSLQGAGGVGGLVAMTDTGSRYFPAYDGNGNVAGLTSASDGSVAASYEYSPFAEPLRVTGAKGEANPIRFSTKYTDDESGWLCYGYRYYNPSTGRWPSRDPSAERGGKNLYDFVSNNPQGIIDPDGRYWWLIIPFLLGGCSQQQCCECVTAVEITSVTPINNTVEITPGLQGQAIGHEVKYKVTVQYQKCAKSGTASMQYVENTDSPPPFFARLGMQPNQDFDTYGAATANGGSPEGFGQWQYRNEGKKIPCSGTKSFTITDTPQMGGPQGIARSRTLSTRMVFTNPSGCASGTASKGWVQNLGWDGTKVTRQELNPN